MNAESISTPVPATLQTPRCKKALALAGEIAAELGHTFIGSEHLLLAVFRLSEGVGWQMLLASGADEQKARAKLSDIYNPQQKLRDDLATALRELATATAQVAALRAEVEELRRTDQPQQGESLYPDAITIVKRERDYRADHEALKGELMVATDLLRKAQPQLEERRVWEQRYNEQTKIASTALADLSALRAAYDEELKAPQP